MLRWDPVSGLETVPEAWGELRSGQASTLSTVSATAPSCKQSSQDLSWPKSTWSPNAYPEDLPAAFEAFKCPSSFLNSLGLMLALLSSSL